MEGQRTDWSENLCIAGVVSCFYPRGRLKIDEDVASFLQYHLISSMNPKSCVNPAPRLYQDLLALP